MRPAKEPASPPPPSIADLKAATISACNEQIDLRQAEVAEFETQLATALKGETVAKVERDDLLSLREKIWSFFGHGADS